MKKKIDEEFEFPFNKIETMDWFFFPNHYTLKNVDKSISSIKKGLNLLSAKKIKNELQLYIHIPFCASLCHYCPYVKELLCNKAQADSYVNNIINEIDYYLSNNYVSEGLFRGITIGGGTPSLLSVQQMEKLFAYLKNKIPNYKNLSKTFTGEPRTIKNADKLRLLKKYDWDRLTFGMQTANANTREKVGRLDSNRDIKDIFKNLELINYKPEISIDLMYNLPGQTYEQFKNELKYIVQTYSPDTLDIYSTVYLPHSKICRLIDTGACPQPASLRQTFRMKKYLHSYLLEKGYNNVCSNTYTKKEGESIYKLGFNCKQDVVPIGAGSYGFLSDTLIINEQNTTDWNSRVRKYGFSAKVAFLASKEMLLIRKLVSFVRTKSIKKKSVNQFKDAGNYENLLATLRKHINLGLAVETDDEYILSEKGVFWYKNMEAQYVFDTLNIRGKYVRRFTSYSINKFDREDRINLNLIDRIALSTYKEPSLLSTAKNLLLSKNAIGKQESQKSCK